MAQQLPVYDLHTLPENPEPHGIYILKPNNFSEEFYRERTRRNIDWITLEEQEMLRNSTVGIFGAGGMGGTIVAILVRLGIGTVILFEPETFDVSNINRQFGATKQTVGKSKAFETARMVRAITDDTTLIIADVGLSESNYASLQPFITRCDIILDEIEFWALGSRLMLHDVAREHNIPIINCNTVGHRTNLWYFSRAGKSLSECMHITTSDAWVLQKRIHKQKAGKDEIALVKNKVMKIFLPEVPEYSATPEFWSTASNWDTRINQGEAIVIATNPPMASGFAANHTLFQLLHQKSSIKRTFILPPEMPGYIMFDAAFMETKRITTQWW